MMSVGMFINAPYAKFWYWHAQPYYIKHIIPRIFPFLKNAAWFTKWPQAIVSMCIDCFFVGWFYMGVMIFFTGMVGTRGDFKASWGLLKEKLLKSM